MLTPALVCQDEDKLLDASTDWTRKYQSRTRVCLKPSSVEQVSEILRYCDAANIAVVPQGGNTGLVGGSVPFLGKEVVLQLVNMSTIYEDASNGMDVVKCQAGCTLKELQDHAALLGLLVPLDLGAKGTCQIGGNLATNAGGQYYYRYKSLAANVLGLKVVLMGGNVLDLNFERSNYKDNTGYKLFQLFLGSEGTLGVITDVAFNCPVLPKSFQTALIVCRSYEHVLATIHEAKANLGEILAAMELMDSSIWNLVAESGSTNSVPDFDFRIGNDDPMYLLVETHGVDREHDRSKMERFLQTVLEKNVVADGVLAQDEGQRRDFWKIRECCNPTVASHGFTYKYDISLPTSLFRSWTRDMKSTIFDQAESKDVVVTSWGHVLDGNLHFNVTIPGILSENREFANCFEPHLFRSVLKCGGSISAEHGLGQSKNYLLRDVHSPQTVAQMQALKSAFDPNGLLNPGKMLPQ